MDHLEQIHHRIQAWLFIIIAATSGLIIGAYWVLRHFTRLSLTLVFGVSFIFGILLILAAALKFSSYLLEPLKAIWQVILHLSPTEQTVAAPQIDNVRLGREL